ncbi:MAG TPA: hypothetical protein VFN21_11855 [Acidimicrobiales bacterium]|nr:hypothetical protein [Acidimicrobiales bacterium]
MSDVADRSSGGHDGVITALDPTPEDNVPVDPADIFSTAVGGGVWPGSDALKLDRVEQIAGGVAVGSDWFDQTVWSAEGWVKDTQEDQLGVGVFDQ